MYPRQEQQSFGFCLRVPSDPLLLLPMFVTPGSNVTTDRAAWLEIVHRQAFLMAAAVFLHVILAPEVDPESQILQGPHQTKHVVLNECRSPPHRGRAAPGDPRVFG